MLFRVEYTGTIENIDLARSVYKMNSEGDEGCFWHHMRWLVEVVCRTYGGA